MTETAGKSGWEQRLTEVGTQAEAEVRRAIAYLNNEVVPEVRRDGARAMKGLAGELRRLADRLDGAAR